MFYVNFVSDTEWEVIIEHGQFFYVVHKFTNENCANILCEALKRTGAELVKKSLIQWWKELANLTSGETLHFHNV